MTDSLQDVVSSFQIRYIDEIFERSDPDCILYKALEEYQEKLNYKISCSFPMDNWQSFFAVVPATETTMKRRITSFNHKSSWFYFMEIFTYSFMFEDKGYYVLFFTPLGLDSIQYIEGLESFP